MFEGVSAAGSLVLGKESETWRSWNLLKIAKLMMRKIPVRDLGKEGMPVIMVL